MNDHAASQPAHPSFREALRFWLKLGFISFGGPTGQIAIMHTELVEKKRWISESRFLHALNYCMLLPGPEAQQLATYIGWLLHGTLGGIVAGSLFVLPSAFFLWALSFGYMVWGTSPWIAAIFLGLKPAVLAIVAAAAIRIGRKALKNEIMWGIAALAFVAIFFFRAPFPLIVATAGFIGWLGGRLAPQRFKVTSGHGSAADAVLHDHQDLHASARNPWARSLRVIVTCSALWWTPVLLIGAWLGWEHSISQQGLFFSKAAMVTFGGAYAVLPYVAQQAVERYGWLTAPQMLDGLGLAETTPGPLIMVLQFVGFVGGWQQPGVLTPVLAATLGAAITTWVTFLPCFLWIFLGAPHIEAMRGNAGLNAALSGVTAAVVGVILNLAIWFGWHILLPTEAAFNAFGLITTLVAFIGLVRWKWDVIPVVLGAGLAGVLWHLVGVQWPQISSYPLGS
jgi:chromate transporter